MAASSQAKGSAASEREKGSEGAHRRSRVFLAVVLLSTCAFVMFSLVSYDPRDPCFNAATQREDISNLCGLFGSYLADGLVQLFGWASIMAPVGLFLAALRLMRRRGQFLRASEIGMYCLLFAAVATAVERVFRLFPQGTGASQPGGALGAFIHGFLERYVGAAGEAVLLATVVALCALYFSNAALHEYYIRLLSGHFWMAGARACFQALVRGMGLLKTKMFPLRPAVGQESARRPESQTAEPATALRPAAPEIVIHGAPADQDIGIHELERISCLPKGDISGLDCEAMSPEVKGCGTSFHERQKRFLDRIKAFPWKPLDQPCEEEAHEPLRAEPQAVGAAPEMAAGEDASETHDEWSSYSEDRDQPEATAFAVIRVSERADARLNKTAVETRPASERDDYVYPPLDLLDEPQISGRSVDKALLETNARVLTQKLAELGIQGQVVEIHPGPVITMYELALAPGIPLRKVLSTADDLAMALKSGSTRVVAPIPGKDTVGIEVPNLYREIVYFREIIESEVFAKSKEPLKVALGKNIDGEPFAASLTKMPHLLIAGATGTGKSVGLNCLICSWLMCCHPDDVKFLMVDPKKLELSYYQDIPHLIHPVVTDAEKVPRVLSWAIREMERRYDLLSKAGAKNIEGYNQKVLSGEISAEDGDKPPEKLPYIVIIVDELAELMMVAAKDIEISIARLAQMARASGIHLILATQRPSVDVITGVIKANFPARISFQVSAKPDSRTILDTTGAENLLGMGDMLFLPPGTAKLRRLHGAYVSENEIRRIADFIKAQRSPVYLQEITRHMTEEDKGSQALDLLADEKYDEAVELVTRLGHASISLIQRHMRIGYNRAARIIEMMESEGIIGPSDGTSRPREVLVRSLASIPDGDERPFAGA
ncbi:MAG: DNA translocase FtsK [Desulfomonilaceae bacterium]